MSEKWTVPFATAEEAWLWFARCQLARIEGVRFTADSGEVARPCEPDDIYRAVAHLQRGGRLGSAHVTVLGRFGCRLAPPDPWAGDAPEEARLWGEAMGLLDPVLRNKGIVL
ncbi:MAG TPA: hypothetical protein VL974_11460 [Magnetospirillum sp.]|nr:hypothetical protein [Magnetospirillum sp.]